MKYIIPYIPANELGVSFGPLEKITDERIREIYTALGFLSVRVDRLSTSVLVQFNQKSYERIYEGTNQVLSENFGFPLRVRRVP